MEIFEVEVILKQTAVTTVGLKFLFCSGDKLQRSKIAYNIKVWTLKII